MHTRNEPPPPPETKLCSRIEWPRGCLTSVQNDLPSAFVQSELHRFGALLSFSPPPDSPSGHLATGTAGAVNTHSAHKVLSACAVCRVRAGGFQLRGPTEHPRVTTERPALFPGIQAAVWAGAPLCVGVWNRFRLQRRRQGAVRAHAELVSVIAVTRRTSLSI